MNRKLNIGFIGSGFVSQVAHLHNYNEISSVNISALAELRPELGKSWKCPICEVDKIREFKNDICLDHSHETGVIRGYICGSCNASIGKFHEKIDRLERAIKWLKGDLKN